MTPLNRGERAPDFTATASDGENYSLHALLAGSGVLLVFYPENDSPG